MPGNPRGARESQLRVNLDRSQQLDLWGDEAAPDGWNIRHSARARRLTMRVFRTGRVEVIVPLRTSRRALERFIHEHREWVQRKREAAHAEARPVEPFPPVEVCLGAAGERLRVHLAGGRGRPRAARIDTAVLQLAGTGAARPEVERALRAWLVAEARRHLGRLLAAIAAEWGFEYERLSVRRQRTRWGSCSTRGTISLNCCLMFQRPEVVRYLVIHELAHTRHMNHSARFWNSVAACCPDYEALDRELLEGWRHVPAWVFGGE